MCIDKLDGGLGLRNLVAFNLALLARAGWQFTQTPENLCSRILRDKYFSNSEFMRAKTGNKASYLWRSLMWGRELLEKGKSWTVGNGMSIDVWLHNWIPAITTFNPFVNRQSAFPGLKVHNLPPRIDI